jgi:hypothetical protein
MQEWGQGWQWYQDDPAHATVEEVVTEIINATDEAVFAGCSMIGEIKELAINTVPDWLLPCDGTEYLGTDYPELWAVIHDNLKTDADHFRTPQRYRTLGWGEVVGQQEGSETHINTVGELVPHHHQYNEVFATLVDPGVSPSIIGIDDINASDTTDTGDGEAYSVLNPVDGAQFYIIAARPQAG